MIGEKPYIPTVEKPEEKLKKELNSQISELLRNGTELLDIVELLDAQEFFEQIETKKGQMPVAHFDVDAFIQKRLSENRKFSLPEKYEKIDEVILPSNEGEIMLGSGAGFKETGIIPRATMLLEVLSELNLKYTVIEGTNDPKMMRQLSYLAFHMPDVNKLVLVNNEEGNASSVVFDVKDEDIKKYLGIMKKDLYMYNNVISFNYPDKTKENHQQIWKEKLRSLLLLDYVQKEEDSNLSNYNNDWMTARALSKSGMVSIGDTSIRIIADKFRMEHPEWFNVFKNKQGNDREHYSPELIKKIIDEYSVPLDWVIPADLSKSLGVAYHAIYRQVDKHRKIHPEWFRIYKDAGEKEHECFSPELVLALTQEYDEARDIPKGWISKQEVQKEIGLSNGGMYNFYIKYLSEHPEWFRRHLSVSGSRELFFHPYFIEIIRKHFANHKPADLFEESPEGWMTNASLTNNLKSHSEAVKKIAECYKISNPEWFGEYKDLKGNPREHYSPELVKIITEQLKGKSELFENAPYGWLTKYTLSKLVNNKLKIIERKAEKYRANHPEWFKMYKNKMGTPREHYSPELVGIIKKYFE